jgi:hypothetical protein
MLYVVEASLDRRIGCYKDYKNRVLSGNSTKLDPNGRKECKQFCQGFRYFGTEVNLCIIKKKNKKKNVSLTYLCLVYMFSSTLCSYILVMFAHRLLV